MNILRLEEKQFICLFAITLNLMNRCFRIFFGRGCPKGEMIQFWERSGLYSGYKKGGGKPCQLYTTYSNHHFSRHFEVPISPGVPGATAVTLHTHLDKSLLHLLGDGLDLAKEIHSCNLHGGQILSSYYPYR